MDRRRDPASDSIPSRRGPPNAQAATYQRRQSQNSNRLSLQSDGPSAATSSPFQSPLSPEFPPDAGLAPRPSSFPYGGPGSDVPVKRSETSRQRDARNRRRISLDKPLPPPPSSEAQEISSNQQTDLSSGPPSGRVKSYSDRSRYQPTQSSQEPTRLSSQRHRRDVSRGQGQVYSGAGGVRGANEQGTRAAPSSQATQDSGLDQSAQQRREWAPDRSPLQKLELTLQDISNEEERAQTEEAELLAREARAGRGTQSRRSGRSAPTTAVDPLKPVSRDGDHLAEAGLVRNLSIRHKDRLQRSATVDTRKPDEASRGLEPSAAVGGFEYQEQEHNRPTESSRTTGRNGARNMNGIIDPANQDFQNQAPQNRNSEIYDTDVINRPAQARAASYRRSKTLTAPNPEFVAPAQDYKARNSQSQSLKYAAPPQTATDYQARQQAGFGTKAAVATAGVGAGAGVMTAEKKHLSDYMHLHRRPKNTGQNRGVSSEPDIQEWRNGGVARLTAADLVINKPSAAENKAWWEERQSSKRRRASASAYSKGTDISALDGGSRDDRDVTSFRPPIHLKCGPLLRFTGNTPDGLWRGSVLIVTTDSTSSYEVPPTLRLFAEPTELLPPPPAQVDGENGELPPEYVDPIAGLPKLSRTGQTLYVKPVDYLDEEVDLSMVEDDSGLFESVRRDSSTAIDSNGINNSGSRQKQSPPRQSGEDQGKFKEVQGVRLHTERGCTFWRFSIEIQLASRQIRIAYRINRGPSIGFWVPGREESMNVMFHSCNGFHHDINTHSFSGPDPMWRDVLNTHQTKPFHVMIGGGDQIYNDAVMKETTIFREWLNVRNPLHKWSAEFTVAMQEELEAFYLDRYCMWFSQGLFGLANSQIPMINIWDDHDIIDGFGSYPHHFMSSPVFAGIGAVAFKYYMLFQHQSVVAETEADEPSWLLGASHGPYIHELSRSVFTHLGPRVAFLGLDNRTERTKDEILSEQSYDLIFDRCNREIIKGKTKHLIVVLGVPIAYPRLNFAENLLSSRLMDPVKAIGRTGILGGFLNQFDGGVEILDDLDDHWTSRGHKQERNWFIQELQELAAAKSIRITILGGDVHLAAVGRFYSNPKLGLAKDADHRYMLNVISSAIVNTAPPSAMADILNRRNKVHHLDPETDEDMIPLFTHDVDGKSRNNKRLLPRRNWCLIREYQPGSTPPPTPPTPEPEYSPSPPRGPGRLIRSLSMSRQDIPPGGSVRSPSITRRDMTPSGLVRSLSMSRRDMTPGGLVRRLSSQGRRASYQGNGAPDPEPIKPPLGPTDSYFPPQADPINNGQNDPVPGRTPFHRQPTDLGKSKRGRTLAKAGQGHVDFENGLEIILNVEVSQKDPAGITVPYRMLVPALFYSGPGDINTTPIKKATKLPWLKWGKKKDAQTSVEQDLDFDGKEEVAPYQ